MGGGRGQEEEGRKAPPEWGRREGGREGWGARDPPGRGECLWGRPGPPPPPRDKGAGGPRGLPSLTAAAPGGGRALREGGRVGGDADAGAEVRALHGGVRRG